MSWLMLVRLLVFDWDMEKQKHLKVEHFEVTEVAIDQAASFLTVQSTVYAGDV